MFQTTPYSPRNHRDRTSGLPSTCRNTHSLHKHLTTSPSWACPKLDFIHYTTYATCVDVDGIWYFGLFNLLQAIVGFRVLDVEK